MIRGLWTHAGILYSVEGSTLYSIDSLGQKADRGTLNSTNGNIDFASNLTQLCVNDGSYLGVYKPSSGTLAFASNYPGGDRISFLDQRINFLYRGTQKFGWTSLGDASTIATLDFFSAESSPDKLISQLAFNQQLVMLGESSGEVWDPIGGDDVYRRAIAFNYGCIAAHSAQATPNSAIWLSAVDNGAAQVMSIGGHQPQRISNRAIEEKFEGMNLARATAFTYSDGGQSFYCLNVPGLESTLVWDETFQQWHERAEWDDGWSPWQPTCHAYAYGKHYFGCGTTLATLDVNTHTYLGGTKRRQRIAPVISTPSRDRVFFSSIEVVCDKGTGANLMLKYSDDNGANWSNTKTATVGAVGEYAGRAKFNRLGSAYDRVLDISMTDDAPWNPTALNVPL